jgi:hypothetical protein
MKVKGWGERKGRRQRNVGGIADYETALASHPGTTLERDLRAEAGEAG